MQKISYFMLLFFLVYLAGCVQENQAILPVNIIPVPVKAEIRPGSVAIKGNTAIICSVENDTLMKSAEMLAFQLNTVTGFSIKIKTGGEPVKNSIFLEIDKGLSEELGNEGYKFESGNARIKIAAASPTGVFYGIQTLYQLLPADIYADGKAEGITWTIPSVSITDYPRFGWRGMHLDVSRHFFTVEFVKRYIDLIAMHKMNIFHWHLTDDNGWRIEIKKYPLLTEVSAWHVDREDKPWDERELQKPGEKATYGGFYTQDQIRDVVRYAAERHITVIPEIEMPGHSSEIFAAYPELSCRGEKLTVQPGSYWPNTDILCAGKDETFVFIENVLAEVAGLFPSQYIHIGGDEADKKEWRACKLCQERIKNEHLSGENELQSYFIKRVEKIVTGLGKKLIGWDEILEGGLAPEATVMSWRGFEGGIAAARQGHDVIMCPTNYCYFDYYQADPEFQPKAIGGLVTLKKVYSFEPVPSELNAAEANHILGGQGNIWTEYIATPQQAEYMAIPRMTALSEVLWSPADHKDWNDFRERLQVQFSRFKAMNINYSEGSAKVMMHSIFDKALNVMEITLESEMSGVDIYYTLDGSEPGVQSARYSGPLQVNGTVSVKAIAVKNGKALEKPAVYTISYHPAIGCEVTYLVPYSERYPAQGQLALVDGMNGSLAFNDGMWQGFNGTNADVVVNTANLSEIHSIRVTFLQDQARWIFLPGELVIYSSDDGKNFENHTVIRHNLPLDTGQPVIHYFEFHADQPWKTNYIRIQGINIGTCPAWHEGNGQPAWIFTDEIVIQ